MTAYGSWSMAGFLVVPRRSGSVRDGRTGAGPVWSAAQDLGTQGTGVVRRVRRDRQGEPCGVGGPGERGGGRRSGGAADAPGRWAQGRVEEVALDGGALAGDGRRRSRHGLGVGTRYEQGEQQDEHPQPDVPAGAAGFRLRFGGHGTSFPPRSARLIPHSARSARSAQAGEEPGGAGTPGPHVSRFPAARVRGCGASYVGGVVLRAPGGAVGWLAHGSCWVRTAGSCHLSRAGRMTPTCRGRCGCPGCMLLLGGPVGQDSMPCLPVASGQRPEARVPWPQPARGWLRAARSSMPVSGYGGRSGCGPTPPSRVLAARPCPQSPACPATPGTHSRRTGRSPKYIQYEGLRPAHREHAPDAAGPALRADDGTLRTRPSRWLWANLRPAAERSAPEGRRRCGRGSPLARAPSGGPGVQPPRIGHASPPAATRPGRPTGARVLPAAGGAAATFRPPWTPWPLPSSPACGLGP